MQLFTGATQVATLVTAGEAEQLPVLPHWGELIFGVIAFAILYWIVREKVVPRLEKMYADRTAAIEGGMHQAEEAQQEAQAALEQYKAQLAEARVEASRIARRSGSSVLMVWPSRIRTSARSRASRSR